MDEDSVLSSPHGRNYGQPVPPPEAFASDLAQEFQEYLTNESTNSKIFTHHRMQQFIQFIKHPNQTLSPKHANNRAFALRAFEVDDGCLYRREEHKPDGNGGVLTIPQRYVALKRNAFRFISDIHQLLQHFGIQKTFERVSKRYYGITQADVSWVVNRCTICNLKAAAQGPPAITPIVANRCLHHFQIDLMDFSTTPDGNYNWVIQGKDPFNKFVLLDGLEDKTAMSVAIVVERWMGIIGRPRRMYVLSSTIYLDIY